MATVKRIQSEQDPGAQPVCCEALRRAGIGTFSYREHTGLTVDDGVVALLACDPADLPARTMGLIHPQDRQLALERWEHLRTQRASRVCVDLRVARGGQGHVWLRCNGSWADDTIVGSVQDVTDLKSGGQMPGDATGAVSAEERVKRQAAELDSLVAHMPTGLITYRYHPDTGDFVLVRANAAAERILGRVLAGKEGTTMAALFPGVEQTDYPRRYVGVAARGEAFTETRNAYQDDTVSGVFDAVTFQSAPNELSIMFSDVSEREQQTREVLAANRALEYLRLRHTLALRASGIGVWEWEVVTNQLEWDEQMYSLYGLSPAALEPSYEGWLARLHPEDRERTDQLAQAVVAGRGEYETEFRVLLPDGGVRTLRAVAEAVRDAAGSLLRLVGVNWDVTTDRMRAAELERSNAELQKFAYVASHDLQAPLRSIGGLADLLDAEYSDQLDAHGRECLQTMVRDCNRLQSLIRQLLEYSRVGSRPSAFTEVDLNQVLREVIEMLEASPEGDGPSVHCPAPLPGVRGDHTQLRQLLQNLVGNGLKYNRSERPAVSVTADRQEDVVRLRVSDNGIGIQHDQLDKIFGVFTRLHHAHEFPGTGIGLAVCERVVQRHGGRIRVTSEPGVGSTFEVELPQLVP